jgi:hypothetical protein
LFSLDYSKPPAGPRIDFGIMYAKKKSPTQNRPDEYLTCCL